MVGALIFASTSAFVSCKDNSGDEYAELKAETAYLGDYIDAQAAALQSQINILSATQKACKDVCDARYAELSKKIADLNGDSIKSLREQIASLKTQDQLLQKEIDTLKNTLSDYAKYKQQVATNKDSIALLTNMYNQLSLALSSVKTTAETGLKLAQQDSIRIDALVLQYASLDSAVTSHKNRLDVLESQVSILRDSVQTTYKRADAAYLFAEANKKLIDSLGLNFGNYYTKFQIDSMRDVYKAQIDTAQKRADDAWALAYKADTLAAYALKAAAQALVDAKAYADAQAAQALSDAKGYTDAQVSALKSELSLVCDSLGEEIDSLKSKYTTLSGQVAALLDSVGILRSDVTNLRNDLNKMMTGVLIQGAVSPVIGQFALPVGMQSNILFAFYGSNTKGDQPDWPTAQFTSNELSMIGSFTPFPIYGGETLVNDMDNGKAYLGTLYTTINPNTVDFTGQTLKLVNSKDEEGGVILDPMAKSDKELTFGYTRANNGFYECDAYAPIDKIQDLKITKNLDVSKLKKVAKDLLNSLKKRTISNLNFTDIYKTIMSNMEDVIPAYGLKASWTDSKSVEHSIYSNYAIAATCVKPASYDFLKDANLPTIPLIDHISYDVDFHLDYPTYQPITNPDLKLNVYIVYKNVTVGSVTNKSVIGVYSNETDAQATVDANPGAWKEKQVFTVQGLQAFIDQINRDIILKLTADIADLEDQIISQTQKNVNKALDKVNTKVVDRVNNIIKKLNARIKNANHYLQPAMIMEGADGNWYKVSEKNYLPTTVKGVGAMLLEPTSLTAEAIAPAYKKFVAVTNVWKNDNPSLTAQGGNADCKARLDYANSGLRMKTVYDDKYDVIFQSDATGYTYEVTYVSIDYSGVSRVIKCYIKTVD